MAKITINSTTPVVPMIYAYTTPNVTTHQGWVKVGYTEKQTVEERIKQQTHTADIQTNLEWKGGATYDDGSGDSFTDHELHNYYAKLGIERRPDTEWFHEDAQSLKNYYYDFRGNRGILENGQNDPISPYRLRTEQEEAVKRTLQYAQTHPQGEFLWNAKPRFGKTLSVYDLCIRMKANNVLIVTNRPAIANSWYNDYERFVGLENGYHFVSEVDALKNKKYVKSRDQYILAINGATPDKKKNITFISLQDLKGSKYFGGQYDKLHYVTQITWDVLVIDEAHEGVDTYKTDTAFDNIKRKFTLHLSGTPFKALANQKFSQDAIYNWTYADEQEAKQQWRDDAESENPYAPLPVLNMFTYQMSEMVKDVIKQGINIDGENEDYAFDLNEFFATTETGKFIHESAVDKFLDALTKQTKYPFSTEELRDELKHTMWLLNRVDSAKALTKKLKEHTVFKDYEVVLAAGDGKLDDEKTNKKSYDSVKTAIANHDKTITLSVGQLTTGVTIPEWTAVLMLCNLSSPSLYMQAAFRAQNPWMFRKGKEFVRKQNAYVFDFDPARTLIIYDSFANDLNDNHGNLDTEKRKENIKRLLNFFPVLGEDEEGEMVELDATKVLSIPRKLKSDEVVNRGFMSNFLFQNIGNIFSAPKEVIDIITQFEPAKEEKKKKDNSTISTGDTKEQADIDADGNVSLHEDYTIGKSQEIFGNKIYETESLIDLFEDASNKSIGQEQIDAMSKLLTDKAVVPTIEEAASNYEKGDLSASTQKKLTDKFNKDAQTVVQKTVDQYNIQKSTIEKEREIAIGNAKTEKELEKLNKDFDQKQADAAKGFKEELLDVANKFTETIQQELVQTVETKKKEKEVQLVQDQVRDHLRGFARTIPSFLMAYGDEETTLENFDKKIPDEVFEDVTSVTIENFKKLRDGFDYVDPESGETSHYNGFFEPIVFNDSIKAFLKKREDLANYFDPHANEDIFDYIPPQKTNQIFTPKQTVQKMVDILEEENPGCFGDPDKTFIDLYMKSGLYITEIVKRIFSNDLMIQKFPNGQERLKHIFEKQVYGFAPTEIIYKIATNYILGFDKENLISNHNFRQVDTLPYAKNGTMDSLINKTFGK